MQCNTMKNKTIQCTTMEYKQYNAIWCDTIHEHEAIPYNMTIIHKRLYFAFANVCNPIQNDKYPYKISLLYTIENNTNNTQSNTCNTWKIRIHNVHEYGMKNDT